MMLVCLGSPLTAPFKHLSLPTVAALPEHIHCIICSLQYKTGWRGLGWAITTLIINCAACDGCSLGVPFN